MRFTFTIRRFRLTHVDLEVARGWIYLNLLNIRAVYMDFSDWRHPIIDRPVQIGENVRHGKEHHTGSSCVGEVV